MSIRRWFDWLSLRDYDEALTHARVSIIKRIARGNVSFQNGNILDEDRLNVLRHDGDRAIAELVDLKSVAEKDAGDSRREGTPTSHPA